MIAAEQSLNGPASAAFAIVLGLIGLVVFWHEYVAPKLIARRRRRQEGVRG